MLIRVASTHNFTAHSLNGNIAAPTKHVLNARVRRMRLAKLTYTPSERRTRPWSRLAMTRPTNHLR